MESLKTVKDTRTIPSICNTRTPGVLQKRNMSCCCTHCMHNEGECLFKEYADNWEYCSVVGHTKSQLKATNELHQRYYEQLAQKNEEQLNPDVTLML